MGVKYEWKSLDLLLSTTESLKKATEQLAQVAVDMQQHGMNEALFPWTQRQWDCLDVLITLTNQCVAVLPSQITAKAQGRESQYEIMQQRSRRDVAVRKVRNAKAAASTVPIKKAARPMKKGSP